MDAATRYAREYLLARPAVVVLRAPTGYLKTSTTRVAAQLSHTSAVIDCRELASAEDVEAALHRRVTGPASADRRELIAFENAEAALDKPSVLAAIHQVLACRTERQTIAICTRRPFPLPAGIIATAMELTHDDLAVDVAAELAARGLSEERIAEIRELTLGWPMPTYRLAALAAALPAGVPLACCASRGYERLLQDVRLDFFDRLTPEQRALAAGEPDPAHALLAVKQGRAAGLLLRDGERYRVPGIVLAALETVAKRPAYASAEPAVVFDVLAGEITVGGEIVHLPRREYEVFVNLAIKGRHVPYDVLLEEVWGDADDDHAKLKVAVGRLRKRLGFDTIRSADAGYSIGANVVCTLGELEELAKVTDSAPATIARLDAIRLRHRRNTNGSARHWPWYAAWSAKIDGFVERATLTLGNDALAHRRFETALERAREAIALNSLGQDAHELALHVLVAQGNVVGARQQLAAYAATLRRTLGIEPPERLALIVREIAS